MKKGELLDVHFIIMSQLCGDCFQFAWILNESEIEARKIDTISLVFIGDMSFFNGDVLKSQKTHNTLVTVNRKVFSVVVMELN